MKHEGFLKCAAIMKIDEVENKDRLIRLVIYRGAVALKNGCCAVE